MLSMLCACLQKESQEKSWIISQPEEEMLADRDGDGEAGTGNLPNTEQIDDDDDGVYCEDGFMMNSF